MATLTQPVNQEDHIRGNLNAPVVIVEYGDFECPHCAIAHVIMKKLRLKYEDQIAFVFRHFPLSTVHEHARISAITAEAAGRQGKFWEMYDLILENQSKLSNSYLLHAAKSLDLDMKTFEQDMQDKKIAEKLESDFESGLRSGVNGTPSFYINGVKYNGAYIFDSMSKIIDEGIAGHTAS